MKFRSKPSFVFILLLILVTSCAAEVPESFDLSVNDMDGEYSSSDLNGYVFTMICRQDGDRNPFNPVSGDDAKTDKLLQRYRDAEELYNCKIDSQDGFDENIVPKKFFAGEKYADLIFTHQCIVHNGGYITTGIINPFSSLDLDLTDVKYGCKAGKVSNTYGDDMYAIYPYFWSVQTVSIMPTMWFNPQVINRFGQRSPFELYEQDKWDWENFREMCHAMRDDTDSDKANWILPMGYTSEPYLELACIYSNNGRLVEIDGNGKMVYALDSPNVAEAMEFLVDLSADGYMTDDGDRQNIDPFCTNKRAFFFEFTHLGIFTNSTTNIAGKMEGEYEWMIFPHGPRGDRNTVTTAFSWYSSYFYLCGNVDTSCAETLLPYLYEPLPGDNRENFEDDFKRINFYSEESYRFYQKMRDEAICDYSVYTPFTTTVYDALKKITRRTMTVTEALSSIKEKVQSYIDEQYNDVYYYGD